MAAVEVCTAELPFRFSFNHALAERRLTHNTYVKVTLADGSVGYGEGVPRGYVTGETADDALNAVSQRYGPALLGHELREPADVHAALDTAAAALPASWVRLPGAGWCAFELARGSCMIPRWTTAWIPSVRSTSLSFLRRRSTC